MDAVVYARKSEEDKNKQVQSIDGQLEIVLPLVKQNGDILAHAPWTDEKSAKSANKRPGFIEMMRFIKKHKIKRLYCWRSNRLARNATEGGVIQDLVGDGLLEIITPSYTYGPKDTATLGQEFVYNKKWLMDHIEDVTRGMNQKVEKGDNPAIAAVGYMNTPGLPRGEKKYIEDPERMPLVKKAWELMLTGKYTVDEVLDKVTTLGLTNRRGKPMTRTSFFYMFHNPIYTGKFRRTNKIHPGNHTAIISTQEFDKVQELIGGKKYFKFEDDPLPFKGFIKCAICGQTITGEMHTKTYKKDGRKQTFAYYRCASNPKKSKCSQPFMKADDMNQQVKAYLDLLNIDPRMLEWVRKALKERNKEEFDYEKKQHEAQTKALLKINEEKKLLMAMKIDGMVEPEEFDRQKAELLRRESKIKNGFDTSHINDWEKVIGDTLTFIETVQKRYNNGNAKDKKMILQILSSNLLLKDKRLELEAKSGFLLLKKAENTLKQKCAQSNLKLPEVVADFNIKSDPNRTIIEPFIAWFREGCQEAERLAEQLSVLFQEQHYNSITTI